MNFQDMKSSIYKRLGKDSSDSVAVAVAEESINTAVLIAALNFQPKELQASTSLTLLPASQTMSVSALQIMDIIRLYNTSDSREMYFVPFELWETLVPSTSIVKYFSVFGTNLYIKTTSSVDKLFSLYYLSYPAALSQPGDSPAFSDYDYYILSIATAISFAAFEETDSANLWGSIQGILGESYKLGQGAKEVISGRLASIEPKLFQMR